MGPDGSPRIAGFNPFPLFDDFRIGLLDEPAHFLERLSAPITQLANPSVNLLGSGFHAGRRRVLLGRRLLGGLGSLFAHTLLLWAGRSACCDCASFQVSSFSAALTSPCQDHFGMCKPSGTSSAEWWYRDIVVVVAQMK